MIDILILTHNNMQTLERCLTAIEQHTGEKYRTYILDNGSTDKKFINYLKSLQKAIVAFSDTNIGVGPGRRYLSDIARDEFLMFLDSDIIVTSKWDHYMLRQFDKFPGVGAVSAKFRKKSTNMTAANGGYYTIENNKYLIVHHYHVDLDINDIRTFDSINCQWLPGGVMMINQQVNKAAKYPPEGYKVGLEDIDFSFQIKKAGFELYNCPYTDFYHLCDLKDEGYVQIRKDKIEFLLSAAFFQTRWGLNPIKSWRLDKTIFRTTLSDEKIEQIMTFAWQHKSNREEIVQYIQEKRTE